MIFKTITTTILISMSVFCFSQSKSNVTDITKLNFLNPGVSYEKRINKNQTLYSNAFLNTFFTFTLSGANGNSSNILLEPSINLQYRFYYNALARESKNKKTELNNLNYLTPIYELVFTKRNFLANYVSEDKNRMVNKIGIVWGIQRNYSKRFSVDFNIGLGYLFTKGNEIDNFGNITRKNISQLTTMGHLNLGFWLNKKKK